MLTIQLVKYFHLVFTFFFLCLYLWKGAADSASKVLITQWHGSTEWKICNQYFSGPVTCFIKVKSLQKLCSHWKVLQNLLGYKAGPKVSYFEFNSPREAGYLCKRDNSVKMILLTLSICVYFIGEEFAVCGANFFLH